jgi:hypothetical protein
MEGASCPSCGAARGPGDRFCGTCGADLSAPATVPEAPAKVPQRTMLGVVPAASPAAPPAAKPAKAAQQTMLGMMSPLLARPSAETVASEPSATPPTRSHAPTMLGMPKAPPAQAGAPQVAPSGQAPGKRLTEAENALVDPSKHTVFGLSEEASGQTATAVPERKQAIDPASHRTMLGVAPAVLKPAAASAKAAVAPQTNHTMLGQAAPIVRQAAGDVIRSTPPAGSAVAAPSPVASSPRRQRDAAPRSFTPVPTEESRDSRGSSATPQLPVKRGLWVVLGAALAGVLVLGAVGIWLLTRGPEVSVRVVAAPLSTGASGLVGGEALEVEVPGSEAGTKVRFAGEERPLAAGRAQFPLRADALQLGDNALAVAVVDPAGSVDTATLHLLVDYRVRADLTALAAQPPGVDVVVDARPGAKVSVDGAPLPLDARGRGTKRYLVPPQASSAFALRARYRIELPGTPAVDGEVNVTLPVTSAQIDRPGPDVVTDQLLLEIAGAVEPTAEVVVAGTPVPVTEGRFLYRANLPEPGEYKLAVVARAPGKAPRVIDIRVRKVSDMTMAAATFKHDPALTYARIAQNPLIYRGQSVAFDGRVYNVEVQGGRSVLQMLALDCPGGARCPLWVEYAQATEATVDSWVRVLGTVAGEQQFRSKQGQVQTVPSVQAQYVLKLAR